MKSCAITGHRPSRFRWKYNERDAGCLKLKRQLRDQLLSLYEKGVRRFYVGGALGVDLWAGEILLSLKNQPGYGDIELVVVIPFPGHASRWDIQCQRRLDFLIAHSTETVVTGGAGEDLTVCYRRRNYYMVDHADYLLAVYDADHSSRSGTGMTVRYAQSKGLPILFIHPDTFAASQFGDNG